MHPVVRAAAREQPVFVKDTAYHAVDVVPPEVLAGFESAFLIRHPAAMLPSLARIWPDFTDEEAGDDGRLRALHDRWLPLYEELHARRLRPSP